MVQAASLFNQLLQHFPRTEFASLVKKHQAERAYLIPGIAGQTGRSWLTSEKEISGHFSPDRLF